MKLVIDIPEEAYKVLQSDEGVDWLGAEHILNAVSNGTPLPRDHGRLIDADLLSTIFTEQYPKNCMNEPELSGTVAHFSLRHILQILNSESCAPTIVEANKE